MSGLPQRPSPRRPGLSLCLTAVPRRKREERHRKVLQARERVEQMKEEKKKQMEQKLAQLEEKTEKVRPGCRARLCPGHGSVPTSTRA